MAEDRNWTARQVIIATLLIVSVAIVFYLLYLFLNIILIFFLSFVISVIVRPITLKLKERGLPIMWGSLLIHTAFIALILAIMVLIAPIIVEQIVEGATDLPEHYARLRSSLMASPSIILRRLAVSLPRNLTVGLDNQTEETIDRVAQLFRYLTLIIQAVLILLSILIISISWTIESERLLRSASILLPTRHREEFREIGHKISDRVGDFVRGQAITMAAVGTLAFIAYLLIGLPYALLLGFIAGIMEAIPFIGPTLGAFPAALVALSIGWPRLIWVVIAAMIIQFLESNVLAPRVMSESVGIHPLVVILSLAVFGTLLGVLGAVLAIPIAAILQLILEALVVKHKPQPGATVAGRGELSTLRYRAQELAQDARHQLAEEDENDEAAETKDAIESIAIELDEVLAQAMAENQAS